MPADDASEAHLPPSINGKWGVVASLARASAGVLGRRNVGKKAQEATQPVEAAEALSSEDRLDSRRRESLLLFFFSPQWNSCD